MNAVNQDANIKVLKEMCLSNTYQKFIMEEFNYVIIMDAQD